MFISKKEALASIKTFWGENINPKRDWVILIFVLFIAMILVASINYKIYKETSSKELFVDISKEQIIIKKIKEKEMKEVISAFQVKKESFDSLEDIKLKDPSI